MYTSRVFLSHQTACLFWAHRDKYTTKSARTAPTAMCFPNKYDLNDARRFVSTLDGQDLHILVHRDCRNRRISGAKIHSQNAVFPANSFREITKDVLVVSPELCFLQAANYLEFNELILYGLELCGSYARISSSDESRYKREPLTSTANIKRYIQNSQGIKGCNIAERSLRYIVTGSASVRESQLVMMMTLPPRLGGFGLPMPSLNYGIKVNRLDYMNPHNKIVLHGDIVWPEMHLIVEYDGKQHGLIDNHESDKQRDHLLLEAGYQVIRFTSRQINNPIEVERLAYTVNKIGGLKRPKNSLSNDSRKIKTQQEILQASKAPWLK